MIGVGRKAVALGGGTGLPMVLGCLLDHGFETTAVVAMADDGGSSGRLREQLHVLPPGDVRNCLVAMAAADDPLREVFQYRFDAGEGLAGHSLGNLVIAALERMRGDFLSAIEAAEEILQTRGHVLPSTTDEMLLVATNAAGETVRGQAQIAHTGGGPVAEIHAEPVRPAPCPAALEAIHEADVVVIGPGSLFTSVIPNLLVEGMAEALASSSALKVYVCNVADQGGETSGMDAAEHVEALRSHGLDGVLDVVLVHAPSSTPSAHEEDMLCDDEMVEPVHVDSDAISRIEGWGIRVVEEDLADPECPTRHHRDRLCRVLSEVLR